MSEERHSAQVSYKLTDRLVRQHGERSLEEIGTTQLDQRSASAVNRVAWSQRDPR